MKIGFVGLGNLGTPIAENILEKNQPLFVYNRTTSKAQPVVEKGAIDVQQHQKNWCKNVTLFSALFQMMQH